MHACVLMVVWLLKVASGRTHNILFATCCEALAPVTSCQLAVLPQNTHNCCGYSKQVRSGRLATSCGCCESVANLHYKVYRSILWETCNRPIDGMLWETFCQTVVSVDLRPSLDWSYVRKGDFLCWWCS